MEIKDLLKDLLVIVAISIVVGFMVVAISGCDIRTSATSSGGDSELTLPEPVEVPEPEPEPEPEEDPPVE